MGIQYVSMCHNYTQPTSGGSTGLVGCPVAHLLIQRFLQLRLYPFIVLVYQYPYAPWCWHIYLHDWVILGKDTCWCAYSSTMGCIWDISWTCHNVMFPWFYRWVPQSLDFHVPKGYSHCFRKMMSFFVVFLKHSEQKKQFTCNIYR